MRSRAVADMFGYTACSIEQLIGLGTWDLELGTVNLANPGAFHIRILIFLSLLALAHDRATEGFFRHIQTSQLATIGNHVAVQLQIITLRIAPHQPGLPVVVYQDGWVDMVPRTVFEEGFSDGILERTGWRVAYSHADGHTVGNLAMGTDIPIELSVAFYCLCCPGTVIGPRETLQSQGRAVVGPVYHIHSRIDTPLLHPEEIGSVLVVAGIDIHATVMNHRCRVAGKPSLYKGVLCFGSQSHEQYQDCGNHCFFHHVYFCLF